MTGASKILRIVAVVVFILATVGVAPVEGLLRCAACLDAVNVSLAEPQATT